MSGIASQSLAQILEHLAAPTPSPGGGQGATVAMCAKLANFRRFP